MGKQIKEPDWIFIMHVLLMHINGLCNCYQYTGFSISILHFMQLNGPSVEFLKQVFLFKSLDGLGVKNQIIGKV